MFRNKLNLAGLRQVVEDLENHGSVCWSWLELVHACGDLKALPEARRVHSRIVSSGLGKDLKLCNHIVNMYVSCGSLREARLVFDKITEKDVVLWTAMISAYRNNSFEAFHLFRHMELDGVAPDAVTFNTVINACASGNCISQGQELHARVAQLGLLHDQFVGTALVNMYGKSGNLGMARKIFREMNTCNPVPWNVMITVYAHQGHCEEAFQVFREMLLEAVVVTKTTYVTLLNACTNSLVGQQVHDLINESGFHQDIMAATAVMNMYGKCGKPEEALRVFGQMTERNTVTWNAIMGLLSQHAQPEVVIQLFRQMILEGFETSEATFLAVLSACTRPEFRPVGEMLHVIGQENGFTGSLVVSTALVDMYAKVESLENAASIFYSLDNRDAVAWNSMISAYAQGGQEKTAVQLFFQMLAEGIHPDRVSFVTVLGVCSSPEALSDGRAIHSSICDANIQLEQDVVVGTALVNMYGKCGNATEARKVFDKMVQRSLVTWNAMLAVYSQHKNGDALLLFQNMQLQGVGANGITMVAVLTACANQGSLVTGKKLHSYIVQRWEKLDNIVESSLLNMYSKCGELEDATRLFIRMQAPAKSSWNTIISARAHHGNVREALKLFYQMQQSGFIPGTVTFVSILSGCSHAGLTEEGLTCFSSMVHDYGIQPSIDHAGCVIDLLARSGLLRDAKDFIKKLPLDTEPNSVVWMSVLGAGNVHGEMDNVKQALRRVIKLESQQ